ncbi:protein kinase [Streptosporangium sp. NBC_01810]|uniref:serine/threonine-protein kinase n=1 Tax=Streptosporangium sp. NBC_01810 TaxID=2975951 RepID=UPI002DDA7ACC|nr:protein kinase [Streptosporangium sp. NBC_01810]WSA27076.1 protein kinase [Streptosporangium sp. NBC_01810]
MGRLGRVGPYTLLERLGRGGMGEVYLATCRRGDNVALKVLHGMVGTDSEARMRLEREVRALRRVESPYVARVVDADLDGDRPYLVMEHIEGETLLERVRRGGPLEGGLLTLAQGLATALSIIHAAGVVHRDLKPANVLVNEDDEPVLIDFGIAHVLDATRLTLTGTFLGTPGYAAPELFADEPVGEPADVHAWAATVAFAATGRPTFGRGTVEAQMYAILNGQADLEGVPAALLPLIRAALHREPAKRPTAALLAGRLGRLARVVPGEAGTAQKADDPAGEQPGPARKRESRSKPRAKGDESARSGRPARAETGRGRSPAPADGSAEPARAVRSPAASEGTSRGGRAALASGEAPRAGRALLAAGETSRGGRQASPTAEVPGGGRPASAAGEASRGGRPSSAGGKATRRQAGGRRSGGAAGELQAPGRAGPLPTGNAALLLLAVLAVPCVVATVIWPPATFAVTGLFATLARALWAGHWLVRKRKSARVRVALRVLCFPVIFAVSLLTVLVWPGLPAAALAGLALWLTLGGSLPPEWWLHSAPVAASGVVFGVVCGGLLGREIERIGTRLVELRKEGLRALAVLGGFVALCSAAVRVIALLV